MTMGRISSAACAYGIDILGSETGMPVHASEQAVLLRQYSFEALANAPRIHEVYHTDPTAGDLVDVRRTDAPPGGADLTVAAGGLLELILNAMIWENDVGSLTDVQCEVAHSTLAQPCEFLQEDDGSMTTPFPSTHWVPG